MKNREKKIYRASLISIIGNSILAAAKIIVGFFAGSMAVIADGIDSASDIVSSFVTLIAAKIMQRPPNKSFPYGYGRADTIATKALSFFVFFAGAQLFIETIRRLVSGDLGQMPGKIAVFVTVFSIAGKMVLALYQFKVGKDTYSNMLKANAKNMRSDIIISISVLVGLFFTFYLQMPIMDKITALIVSVWIMFVAYSIFMESNYELMDGTKDHTIYNTVFDTIDKIPEVHNPHRVRVRKVGHRLMIAADIEVRGDMSLSDAHKLAHNVDFILKEKIENVLDVVIHVEPLGDTINEENLGLSRKEL